MRNESPTLQQLLNSAGIRRRFDELLDTSAASFISSILTIVHGNSKFKDCSPNSILSAAGIAAALKLPINPSLGFAYIIPYKDKAQFQMGWKGYVQLAMRSSLYRTLHSGKVCEGQIKDIDFITGEIIRGEKISDEVVGYVAYMELLNGFNKSLYMSNEELLEHAQKYSQSYSYDLNNNRKTSVWSTNFDAMAKKTVLKKLLNSFGIISIDQITADLTMALKADQAVITKDGFRYVDNEHGEEKVVSYDEFADNIINEDDYTPEDGETVTEDGEVVETDN